MTVPNITIIFNRRPPGPIPLTDDGAVEIFTDFAMRFCGNSHDSVWVNGNGNLTFGAPSPTFSESAAAMLLGPPRIAGLFDDLNPEAGGAVRFDQSAHALVVHFEDVPEFDPVTGGGVGANTFSIAIRRSLLDGSRGLALHGGRVTIDYGDLSATDGAAGYSCGGKVTSGFELETDFSRLRLPFVLGLDKAAVYEVFTAAENDLDGSRFDIFTPKPFPDPFEPNNTLPSGPGRPNDLVKLPFSTADRHSALAANDVDFYRFRVNAGDILAVETLPGSPLDTMVGLFDAAGNLVALDDDGGVGGAGSLSRLLLRVPVAGVYTVGVTTWPDYGFTGAGSDGGRYVLSIRTYTGTVLPLADESSLEVPLSTFQFPFQGSRWSSLFVNDNGNLTFGTGNVDFSESVAELLSGPPRIAAMWDDLAPTDFLTGDAQGLVIAEEKPGRLQVHFVSVPEFLSSGTNYFTVDLDAKGNVRIDYGATNRSDGIVGVSPGGGAADPGPTDLSRAPALSVAGTTYQTFGGSFAAFGGVDLSFTDSALSEAVMA